MKLKSRTLTNIVARAASAKIGGNQHAAALFSYEPGFLRLVMCDNRSDNNTTLHMVLSDLNIRNSRIRVLFLDMRILIFIYYKKV